MSSPFDSILPNRKAFESDPIGYSALAWHKLGMAATLSGFDVDISKPPTNEDLKSPVLWLTQAYSMAESARILVLSEPNLDPMPPQVRGVCDCQCCAIALMLVGYSLEICLKAMLIIKKGIETYTADEKKHKHHDLVKLSEFLPNLDHKEKAILQALSHFTLWAGRYPDPGSGRIDHSNALFTLSESNQITAKDLFGLSTKVMQYTQTIIDNHT